MVWCNELVGLLARLLLTTAHPDTVKLHNQDRTQQQILQQMRQAVHPELAAALGWSQQNMSLCKPNIVGATAGQQSSCPNRHTAVGASMHIADNQVFVVGQQAGGTCTNQ